MPISRLISIPVLVTILWSQPLAPDVASVSINLVGIDSSGVENSLDSLMTESGEAGLKFELSAVYQDSGLQAEYLSSTIPVKVDSLVFSGLNSISLPIANRIFKPLIGSELWDQSENRFKEIIASYTFLNTQTQYSPARYGTRNVAAVIDLQPSFSSDFSGLLGANRDDQNQWQITGQLDLHLENAFNSAGLIDLNWSRKNELSQKVFIGFEEPHPLALPLGISVSFSQNLNDGLYARRATRAGVVLPYSFGGRWTIGAETGQVIPTAKGDSIGVNSSNNNLLYTTIRGDSRDDRWLPQEGDRWKIYVAGGMNKIASIEKRMLKYAALVEAYKPLADFVLKYGFWVEGIILSGDFADLAQEIKFGGATTLRGYQEEFFSAAWVAVPRVDIQYVPNKNLRLFTFIDVAIQDAYSPWPLGYGIGLIQNSKGTVINISYGIGRWDKLSGGKLHFQVINRL